MSSNQIVTGNQLCFGEFEDIAPHFRIILNFVQKSGFHDAFSTNTRIYTKLVEELYLNGRVADGVIKSKVKNINVTFISRKLCILLGFINEGESSFESVDTEKGLESMGYKKNPELKGLKKKEFPQAFEFLTDIVGKYILYKDSAHDFVSELQLQIMTVITMEMKINYGAVIFGWISKWFETAEKRKAAVKPLPKMFYGRFISIVLKKKLKKKIGENE